jgi:hypothetical protein
MDWAYAGWNMDMRGNWMVLDGRGSGSLSLGFAKGPQYGTRLYFIWELFYKDSFGLCLQMTLFFFLDRRFLRLKRYHMTRDEFSMDVLIFLVEGFFVKIDGALCFMNNTYGLSHGHKRMMLKRGGTPDDVFDSTRNESRTC